MDNVGGVLRAKRKRDKTKKVKYKINKTTFLHSPNVYFTIAHSTPIKILLQTLYFFYIQKVTDLIWLFVFFSPVQSLIYSLNLLIFILQSVVKCAFSNSLTWRDNLMWICYCCSVYFFFLRKSGLFWAL